MKPVVESFWEIILGWINKYIYHLAYAAIILYNNWILGFLVNLHATLVGATASELAARDQPWATLFLTLDIVAGLLLLFGVVIVASLGQNRLQQNVLRFAMFALSFSTVFEAFIRLDCSSAVSESCAQSERLGLLSWQHNLHIYESVAAYLLMFLLPITMVLSVRDQPKAKKLKRISWVLIVFMIIWALESMLRFADHDHNFGYEQRLFIIIFSTWFIIALRTQKHRASLKNKRT